MVGASALVESQPQTVGGRERSVCRGVVVGRFLREYKTEGGMGWWWEGKVDRVEARRRSNGNSTSPASYEKFEKRQKGKKKKFLAFLFLRFSRYYSQMRTLTTPPLWKKKRN